MRAFTALMLALITFFAAVTMSTAKPILKPAKYYGPIPKRAFSLQMGFLAGPTNEEMFNTINSPRINPSYREVVTEDFGTSLIIDGTYTIKLHPRFAFRVGGTFSLLRSSSNGKFIPSNPDSLLLYSKFNRSFNIDNFTIEGDAIYYFTDASVDEFQPYFGGGFSIWIPHAKYSDERTDVFADSVKTYDQPVRTKWSFEAGVQGIIGALYYITNSIAISAESRYHIAQSTFPLRVNTASGYRDISFQINYTGFVITVGIMKGF